MHTMSSIKSNVYEWTGTRQFWFFIGKSKYKMIKMKNQWTEWDGKNVNRNGHNHKIFICVEREKVNERQAVRQTDR